MTYDLLTLIDTIVARNCVRPFDDRCPSLRADNVLQGEIVEINNIATTCRDRVCASIANTSHALIGASIPRLPFYVFNVSTLVSISSRSSFDVG